MTVKQKLNKYTYAKLQTKRQFTNINPPTITATNQKNKSKNIKSLSRVCSHVRRFGFSAKNSLNSIVLDRYFATMGATSILASK